MYTPWPPEYANYVRSAFLTVGFGLLLTTSVVVRAGHFGRGHESSIELLMGSARALAQLAAVRDDWAKRKDLRAKVLADIVEAQTVLGFRSLSQHDYQPTSPSLPLVLSLLERHVSLREREVLVRIYPQLIELWRNEAPWLQRGLAYVKLRGDRRRLPNYIGYRVQNFSEHCASSLKRVGFYVLRNLFGAQEVPSLSWRFRDEESWRGALAVVSFKHALEISCEPADQ